MEEVEINNDRNITRLEKICMMISTSGEVECKGGRKLRMWFTIQVGMVSQDINNYNPIQS